MTDEERGLFASLETFIPRSVRQAGTFVTTAARHFINGMPTVPPEIKAKRLELCTVCEKYDAASERCTVCGCNMRTKAGWAMEKCPLGKWD